MCNDAFLWAWGALGAFLFGSGSLGLSLFGERSSIDADASKRAKALAIYTLAVAVLAGAVSAQVLSMWCVSMISKGIAINGLQLKATVPCVTVAAGIGYWWNLLAPEISKRLVKLVQTFKGKQS